MRPPNLIYALDDRPSPSIGTLLGLQHVSIVAIAFVFPVLLVRETGGTTLEASFMVSMSMLAGAVGVIVQALKRGPLGSGYLCPQVCGPSFLTASLLAAHAGGLPLVLGMTMFAGAFEALLSRVLHKLRFLFPAEVTGVIVSMVGITVIAVAGKNFLGFERGGNAVDPSSLTVAMITLLTMIGLNVWSKGNLKLFCILVGMLVGYGAAMTVGLLPVDELTQPLSQPIVWNPFAHHPGWSFDIALTGPFAVAVLCSMLKSVGDLTTCQRINKTNWVRPDMENIRKGVLGDATGCFAAGVFGGMAQSTSSANIGLSIATKATSRTLSLFIGGILALLAFCPKLAAIFAVMPAPVVGATLFFALSFMIVAGVQIMTSRMLDARKTFVIGLSIIAGLLVDVLPEAFTAVPPILQPVFSSSLSACTITAVLLNLIFRIGIKHSVRITISKNDPIGEIITKFMDKQGAAWGARPEIIARASTAVMEYLEALREAYDPNPATVQVSFDELHLKIQILHQGTPLPIPEQRPTPETLLESEKGMTLMGAWMCARLTDNITSTTFNGQAVVKMHWEH